MLSFAFTFATIILVLQGINFPGIPLNAYIPWIALIILRYPLQKDLFKPLIGAAAVGILVDLFSDFPLGLYPISYTLAAAFLFRFRNFFLYDRPLHLAVFTSFVSFSASILQLLFLFLFDRSVPLPGQWILLEMFATAVIDGIYALIWFSWLLYLWMKARRKWVIFWKKKRKYSPA